MSEDRPKHWQKVALSEIAEVRLGRQRSPKRAVGDYMRPYMRAANVTWQGIDATDVKEMDFTPKEFETYELRAGDILLSEASGSASEVGKPAIWRNQVPGACFQNTLIRVRAREELVPFLHLHFLKDALTGAFASASRGVGIHHLGAEAMSAWPVTMPPLAEQRSIVAAIESHFSRLDAATATLERVQRNLERYRASVLKAAVEGRLVPTEAELAKKEGRTYEPASVLLKRILTERRRGWEEVELAKLTAKGKKPTDDKWKAKYEVPAAPDTDGLPELPEGWCWVSIEQLISDAPRSIQSGPFGSNLLHSEFQPTGRLVIGIDNVRRGSFSMGSGNRISDAKFRELEKYLARAGDVLVTVMATVGRCCVVPDNLEPAIVTKHVYRMSLDQRLASPHFLMQAILGGPSVRAQMQRDTRGQTRPGINGEILRRLVIPLPPRSEQNRIVAQVDRLLSMVDQSSIEVDRNVVQISRLRQSILKWAFEGHLVHPEAYKAAVVLASR